MGTMGIDLKNPPLVEALCEFRFEPSSPWDWTIPGQLYDQIRETFPEKSGVGSVEVGFKAGEGPATTTFHSQPEKVQLKRSDGSALVQIGPHLLVINQLRPYENWQRFRGLIQEVYEEHAKIAGKLPIFRIGLRYINRLETPSGEIDIKSLLTIGPPLEGALEKPLLSFYQRYELTHKTPLGILIHQTGIAKNGETRFMMLDLDFVGSELTGVSGSQQIYEYLDAAHDRIEEAFIASLNPNFLNRLKKGVE